MFKSAFIFVIVYFLSFQFGFAATAKTIEGKCYSQNKADWFKTKTFIDLDDDGKWDYLITRWSNDKITKTPLKIIFPGNPTDFDATAVPIHHLDNIEFDEEGQDSQFTFFLREDQNGPILAIEQKIFTDDTCYIYVLADNMFREFDEATQKVYPLGVFDPQSRMYIGEVYLNEPRSVTFYLQPEQGEIFKVKGMEGKKGWNVFYVKVPDYLRGSFQFKAEAGEIGFSVPLVLE